MIIDTFARCYHGTSALTVKGSGNSDGPALSKQCAFIWFTRKLGLFWRTVPRVGRSALGPTYSPPGGPQRFQSSALAMLSPADLGQRQRAMFLKSRKSSHLLSANSGLGVRMTVLSLILTPPLKEGITSCSGQGSDIQRDNNLPCVTAAPTTFTHHWPWPLATMCSPISALGLR